MFFRKTQDLWQERAKLESEETTKWAERFTIVSTRVALIFTVLCTGFLTLLNQKSGNKAFLVGFYFVLDEMVI